MYFGYILGVDISSHHYLYWRMRADSGDSLHVLSVDTMKTRVSGSGRLQGHMHFMVLWYKHWIYVIPTRSIKAVFALACLIEIIVIPNIYIINNVINCPGLFIIANCKRLQKLKNHIVKCRTFKRQKTTPLTSQKLTCKVKSFIYFFRWYLYPYQKVLDVLFWNVRCQIVNFYGRK